MDETEHLSSSPVNEKKLRESIAQIEGKRVKILFFGVVADKFGKRSAEAQAGITLSELIEQVGCTENQILLVAVNQEQIHDLDYVVQDGDEVALMPPFSGG